MLLLSHTEDGNVNANLDNPESNLGYLQALQFSIGQILFKLLIEERRERIKKKIKKNKKGRDWESAFPDRLWHVSICSYSIKWPSLSSPIGAHDGTSFITVSAVLL